MFNEPKIYIRFIIKINSELQGFKTMVGRSEDKQSFSTDYNFGALRDLVPFL